MSAWAVYPMPRWVLDATVPYVHLSIGPSSEEALTGRDAVLVFLPFLLFGAISAAVWLVAILSLLLAAD